MGRLLNIIFKSIQSMLDRDRIKYEDVIKSKSDNGKKGGRPKKEAKKANALSDKLKKLIKATQADSVSVPDSVSVSVPDIDIDTSETYISKDIWEQALVVSKWNEEINTILEIIKGQIEFLGFIYKKGKYERERAKNILTGKDFWEVCEKANMPRVEFCKQIIFLSTKLDFWNWKIYNSETLYKHYAQVYNDAKSKKEELENRPRRWLEV